MKHERLVYVQTNTYIEIHLKVAKRNYKMYNKELLAIVEALTKQRQYLLDTIEKFEVQRDYENPKYFRELHKLNG